MKNIFAAAVIATSILCVTDTVTPQKAEAATCGDFGRGSLCNEYQFTGRRGQVYSMAYHVHDNHKFYASVTCDDRNLIDWSGKKWGMSESEVRYIVTEFCALPN